MREERREDYQNEVLHKRIEILETKLDNLEHVVLVEQHLKLERLQDSITNGCGQLRDLIQEGNRKTEEGNAKTEELLAAWTTSKGLYSLGKVLLYIAVPLTGLITWWKTH